MAKKNLFLQVNILPFILLFLVSTTTNAYASSKSVAIDTKALDAMIQKSKEERTEALNRFFTALNSPLKANSATFVEVADKYNLDYRLLPAISCMESTCGRFLIEGSYNPFGWGIYGKNAIYFKSYDEAIETVGREIKEKYASKGLTTPETIAPVYTPPNYVNWRNGVNYFISRIDSYRDYGTGIQFLG